VDTLKGWIAQAREFLREVLVELKKVTWPMRQETIGSTGVVVVMVIVMAAFFYVVDVLLTAAVRLVL
jgi:preprotein translocase subunit SecE